MARLFDPPLDQLDQWDPPLTPAERQIINIFDEELNEQWECYVNPVLNGLCPSLVFLHPRVGVAVFHVFEQTELTEPLISAAISRSDNFTKEIYNLYCPRLASGSGLATVTSGLLFPNIPNHIVKQAFSERSKKTTNGKDISKYQPVAGKEDIDSKQMEAIFPEWSRRSSLFMREDHAADLRGWLKEPAFRREQRQSLILDHKQEHFVTTRTNNGFRRIRGPAGSGKSVVLAARAAQLADEGKSVLVVSFNITLLRYLRDHSHRHWRDTTTRHRRNITFLNFHHWCRRVCMISNDVYRTKYNALWSTSSDSPSKEHEDAAEHALNHGLAGLVQELYDDDTVPYMSAPKSTFDDDEELSFSGAPLYDAILVDEGQDWRFNWWDTLRKALHEDGEMVLVADFTQDIYGVSETWDDDRWSSAGFIGAWAQLDHCYRLAPALVNLLRTFVNDFCSASDEDTLAPVQQDAQLNLDVSMDVNLRWVHVNNHKMVPQVCFEAVTDQMQELHSDTAIPDITFLGTTQLGKNFVKLCKTHNIPVQHTFGDETTFNLKRRDRAVSESSRRQKRAFFMGDGTIRATTIHSFKGWESRHLVVFVGYSKSKTDRSLLYTAMTRCLASPDGCSLTVVSVCDELKRYGANWPNFEVM